TDGEGNHEAQGPAHWRGETQTALIDREQPVEQLHTRRDGDQQRRQTEAGVDGGGRTQGEEVVHPHQAAQYGNRARGVGHRGVPEQTLAGEGRDDFGEDTERRQNQDVNLRVTPCPEQVHVHHWVTTQFVREDVEVQVTVEGQERQGA